MTDPELTGMASNLRKVADALDAFDTIADAFVDAEDTPENVNRIITGFIDVFSTVLPVLPVSATRKAAIGPLLVVLGEQTTIADAEPLMETVSTLATPTGAIVPTTSEVPR